jgi:CDP-diacylglycerol--serine O-phosphatidyltransferase
VSAPAGEVEAGRLPGGLTLRALVPNAITAAAVCIGLTGIRFAIVGDFEKAVQAVILAGMLDGIDGRIARLLKAQSRFGAELDSLADSISFGVGPALIVYLWTLVSLQSWGWLAALAFAVSCVLRLARFNARIDLDDQPHKTAGFLTGVPAPVGAGLAFLPRAIRRADSGRGLAAGNRLPDDFQRADAELVEAAAAAAHPAGTDPCGQPGGGRADNRTLADLDRDLRGLSADDTHRPGRLCPVQAAARSSGCNGRLRVGALNSRR